jgi:hypothetical protein
VQVAGEAGAEGGAHARPGGQVEHGRRPGQQRLDLGRGQVEPLQLEPGPGQQPGQVGPLVGRRVVAGEGVHPDHLVAAVDQGLGQVGADEAGGAGDDDVVATSGGHGRPSLVEPNSHPPVAGCRAPDAD